MRKLDDIQKKDWYVFTPFRVFSSNELTKEVMQDLRKDEAKCYEVHFNKTEKEFHNRFNNLKL